MLKLVLWKSSSSISTATQVSSQNANLLLILALTLFLKATVNHANGRNTFDKTYTSEYYIQYTEKVPFKWLCLISFHASECQLFAAISYPKALNQKNTNDKSMGQILPNNIRKNIIKNCPLVSAGISQHPAILVPHLPTSHSTALYSYIISLDFSFSVTHSFLQNTIRRHTPSLHLS